MNTDVKEMNKKVKGSNTKVMNKIKDGKANEYRSIGNQYVKEINIKSRE